MKYTLVFAVLCSIVAPVFGAACDSSGVGSTALEIAANGLSAGEWCEMTPAMLNFTQNASTIQDVLDSCGEASNVAQYANNMAYDPSQGAAGKIWWWGSAHGGSYRGFVYDLDDNEFRVGPLIAGKCHAGETTCQSDWESSPSGACSSCSQQHANDGIADDNNGNFYHMQYNSPNIWRITLPSTVSTSWETCPTRSGTGALDFWPEYGAAGTLVMLCGGYSPHNLINFYDLSTGAWSQPFSPLTWSDPNGNINNLVNYNPGSGEIWITQGDGTPGYSWRLRLVGGTPTLSQNNNAPMALDQTSIKAVDDPVGSSGKFVVWQVGSDTAGTSSNGWWEYDLGTDTWTTFSSLGITSMPPLWSNKPDPGNMSVLSVSIPEYGASVWLSHQDDEGTNNGGMFVYKHSHGDSGPPPDEPRLHRQTRELIEHNMEPCWDSDLALNVHRQNEVKGVGQESSVYRIFGLLGALVISGSVALGATVEIHEGDSFEAAAESLNPGDTLIVHAGTYADAGRISIGVQGSAQAPVVIKGAEGEPRPLVTRLPGASIQNTINIEGATHLTVKGLEITSNGGDGINMNSNPSYITLEDLEIHDIAVGVNFRSSMHHITVRGNHIYDTSGTGEGMYVGCNYATCAVSDSLIEGNWIHDTLQAEQGDGIEIKRGSHSNIIRDNVIHDTNYPCILLYGTEGNPRNQVEGNAMWNCGDSGIQAAADAVIRNNIILDSPGSGFNSQDHQGVTPNNLEFVHNTVVNGNPCLRLNSWSNKQGMVLANNAVYCPTGSYVVNGLTGVAVSGNVITPATSQIPSSGYVVGGSIGQDFVDAAARNVYPSAGSTLIDAGDSAYAIAVDFNGTPRTGAAEAGAYAWTADQNPGWPIGPGFKDTDPPAADPPAPPGNLRVQ